MNYTDLILSKVARHEGGYVNDPDDPGGETNRGITIKQYRAYTRRYNIPQEPLIDLTLDMAQRIYRHWYIAPFRHVEEYPGLYYCCIDYGINSGVGQSGKDLRRAINEVLILMRVNTTLSVVARPLTESESDIVNSIARAGHLGTLIKYFISRRRTLITRIIQRKPSQRKYLKNWTRRVNKVEGVAYEWTGIKQKRPRRRGIWRIFGRKRNESGE